MRPGSMLPVRTAGRVVRAVVTLLVLGLVGVAAVTGWRTWHDGGPAATDDDECVAVVGGHRVSLDREQARWAGLIVAISVQRGLPARAASIGLATAFQESGLHNLREGDRDSLGLFQQRPSQGWGTPSEILDPVHATEAFYDALVRVPDYPSLPITVAAQEVQRSGFPTAYADHEQDARALASALTGNSAHAFTCRLVSAAGSNATGSGSLRAVDRDLAAVFPGTPGVRSAADVAVDVPDTTRGWAVAQYLVSQAHRLGLAWVSFDGRTWRSQDGVHASWQRDASTSGPTRVRVAVAA